MTAFICDLDGLLVDSEQIHFEAYRVVLGEYGIRITQKMFVEGWLSGSQYGTRKYMNEAGIFDDGEIHRVRMKKAALFREMGKGKLKLMPGAQTFLDRMVELKIPCGIGTGGYRDEYRFSVEACGLDKYFSVIVGGDEVPRNKPAPDIFLKVAELLGAEPGECVVFENSDIGALSALNAGMRCIVIPSPLTRTLKFPEVTAKYTRLDEIDLSAF